MYLGKPSISNLRSFLSGYFFARRELEQVQTQDEKRFSEFQTWIKAKYKVSSNQSWDKVILFFSEDENSALLDFFELFKEFSSSRTEHLSVNVSTIPPIHKTVDLTSEVSAEK
jgi:hypothetical protein